MNTSKPQKGSVFQIALALVLAPSITFAQATASDKTPPQGSESQSTSVQSPTSQGPTPPTLPPTNAPQTTTPKTPQKPPPTAPAPNDSTSAVPTAMPANAPVIPAVPAGGPMPGVKVGTVEDVGAVGNRDIGGRGMGNWYSTESEIKMGKGYAAQLEKSTKFINDPVVTEYVNRIGQNLVKNSDAKVPFTIKVIDSDEINAMALPGGFFYVNSGLILNADEEAELAGVMAHEIAHVAAHHAAREQTRLNYAQLGMIPVMIFVGGWTGYGIYEGAQLAIPITFLKFSRDFESQADYLGVQYLYRAGYDPQAFVSFFEKIQNLEKRKPGSVSKAFASHPQTPDRIEHSQEEIARILPPREEYLVTTSEFDDVKARLARIQNKRKLNDSKDSKKPTLRRASTDPNNTTENSGTQSDDKPTLHRRDNN